MKNILKAGLFAGFSFFILTTLYMYLSFDPGILREKYPYPVISDQLIKFELKTDRPQGWVSLQETSPYLKGAIVLTEDWSFYQHQGLDFSQIKTALSEMLHIGRVRGASTISQQMVKNVFLTEDRTLSRKYHELILTLKAERDLPKDKILEVYMNVADFGPRILGVRQASQHFFGKEPGDISAKEAAFIAMMLPSPMRYYKAFREKKIPPQLEEKLETILAKMRMSKIISKEEFEKLRVEKFSWEVSNKMP